MKIERSDNFKWTIDGIPWIDFVHALFLSYTFFPILSNKKNLPFDLDRIFNIHLLLDINLLIRNDE